MEKKRFVHFCDLKQASKRMPQFEKCYTRVKNSQEIKIKKSDYRND